MTKRLPIVAVLAGTIAILPAVAAPPKGEIQVPWEVKPDPLPFKMDGTFQTNKQIPLAHPSPVVFPTSPSPYFGIFVPGDKKESAQLKMYDLRGMEQVGQTIKHDKLQFPQRNIRVSPWGDHIAILDNKAEKATVLLATVTDAKIVASITPHEGKEKIECFDFAGRDQLITCMEVDGKRTWRIWDVKTGKEIRSFDYPLEFSERWMAFSPSRRYLVMQETHIQSYQLLFWDLRKGECVGKIPMQDPKAPWGQCGNLAFSNDGKELALIWYLGKDGVLAKIMRYDLEKGTKICEYALGKEIEPAGAGFLAGGMCTFQFLPDDRGWLVSGCQIVERETGIPVWTIEPHPRGIEQTKNRRFLDVYHLTDQTKEKKLQFLTLPKGELDAAFEKARSKAKDVKN
jgi:WD40 repeat protein